MVGSLAIILLVRFNSLMRLYCLVYSIAQLLRIFLVRLAWRNRRLHEFHNQTRSV